MPIIREARYFGPGLPERGTPFPDVAYREGLRHAQLSALHAFLNSQKWTNGHAVSAAELVDHSGEIHAVIVKATDTFADENRELEMEAARYVGAPVATS